MEIRQYLPLSQNKSELIATETFLLVDMTEIDVRGSKQSFLFPRKLENIWGLLVHLLNNGHMRLERKGYRLFKCSI